MNVRLQLLVLSWRKLMVTTSTSSKAYSPLRDVLLEVVRLRKEGSKEDIEEVSKC